ncbi:hypothetical protein IW146_004383 [Coemansia sp. RSA 922]|nr:hypothetical protein IW146_004383 [Coemansia sp. RSA 922]
MLAQRAFWLSATYKAFEFTSRQRHSLLQTLLLTRHLSNHSPVRPSADIQKAIVEEIHLLQQVDKSIPWYPLAAKYRLSVDALQSICNQAEVDAQGRQQKSVLTTRAAERHFDNALGRCDWEAVASELNTPLIECLDLFDVSNSTIQPRSLIKIYGGWSKTDMERLRQFIAANYVGDSTVDWKCAGVYMNVDYLECQRVGLGTFSSPLNEVGYRRICEFRDSKMRWKDIHQYFLQYSNVTSLMDRYYRLKSKLNGGTVDELTAEWTDAERERTKDLIEQHVESTSRSELVDIIKHGLPARPLRDIRNFCRLYTSELEMHSISLDQMTRLRELVAEYGEDWGRVGEALGVLPSRAQYNWVKYGGDEGYHSVWTVDETRRIQRLIDSGVKPQEAAKPLGLRSPRPCQAKLARAGASARRRRDNTLPKTHWSAADDDTLSKMVDGLGMNTAVRWELVSKSLGRSVKACQVRVAVVNRSRRHMQVMDDKESLVTSEVQRQFESSGAVDWSQVSQATELGLRECLELSQYDVYKVGWQYGLDSLFQDMVDRMTSFIKEHYPVPTPVNYRAVSNYMWVAMEDCIRIHDILQGKFKWTRADYERASALRAQGLTLKEVARHLSPTLSLHSVYSALKVHPSSKQVQIPISADELEEISRLIDEYAGKYPVVEIIGKIRRQLGLCNRSGYYSKVAWRIAAHPHYRTKLRGIDYNDLANRIATGQTTVKLTAKELDVPRVSLVSRLSSLSNKLFPSRWTDEETLKLVDYAQSSDSKFDPEYFSKVVGTKSAQQCSDKVRKIKRKGVLPRVSKV